MEEIKTTEKIDQEILDDAHKKADKIAKNADDAIEAARQKMEARLKSALDELRARRAKEFAEAQNEVGARLVLDRRRADIEAASKALSDAEKAFFDGLPHETTAGMLQSELSAEFASVLADRAAEKRAETGATVKVDYRALSAAEAKSLVEKAYSDAKGTAKPASWTYTEAGVNFSVGGSLPAIVVDNGSVRIRASVDDLANDILEDKRGELVEALTGKN
jgi:vacuolar-type H+-ATPase subunit E/Vma4